MLYNTVQFHEQLSLHIIYNHTRYYVFVVAAILAGQLRAYRLHCCLYVGVYRTSAVLPIFCIPQLHALPINQLNTVFHSIYWPIYVHFTTLFLLLLCLHILYLVCWSASVPLTANFPILMRCPTNFSILTRCPKLLNLLILPYCFRPCIIMHLSLLH